MKGKAGIFVLVLVLLGVSYFLEQQSRSTEQPKQDENVMTVTGKVTNKENGNAIVKVLVEIQASPTQTVTGMNGEYSISAKKGDLLVVSHPRYRRMTVEVSEDIQDIQLTPKE